MPLPDDSDDLIVRSVLDGDTNAFAVLVDRHQAHVARVVAGHVPFDRAQDVAQNTFVNAFKGLSGYKGGSKFPNWLSRIAVRCCYDFWRGQYKTCEMPLSLSDDSVAFMDSIMADSARTNFEAEADRAEAQEILSWALAQLSAEDRMVITLTALEEKSVAEAAELLGWTRVNVKVRAMRVRKKLRQILEKAGYSEVQYG